jgi:hypothetical protein
MAMSLAKTYFPVRDEFLATFGHMQNALLQAANLGTINTEFPHKSADFATVQMTNDMSCEIVHDVRVSDATSHLEAYFGPVKVKYRVGGASHCVRVNTPAFCCRFTSGAQSIVINSYTRPEFKAETPVEARFRTPSEAAPAVYWRIALSRDAVFSQHFVVTQDARYKQAPVRRVLAGRDINRSLPCHARFQSHRDARRLAKAEHDAVRRACGFSDAAWERSELSCTPQFSVWATPHVGAGVHVASVFLH